MKKKRDRSVTALIVLDLSERAVVSMQAGPALSNVELLLKRFAYRFQYQVFRDLHPALTAVHSPEAVHASDTGLAWLGPLLQAKNVSCAYVCGANGAPFDACRVCHELGIATFLVADACAPSDRAEAEAVTAELAKMGVSVVQSGRI